MYKPELILGKRLLFITAHPDDESFTSAGTIYKNSKAGGETYIICATLGEKGSSHLKKKVTEAELKKIRKKEFERVSKFLGAKKYYTLNIPDSKLNKNKKKLAKAALKLASVLRPDFILSFDKFGLSGHTDHSAAAAVALQLSKQTKTNLITFTLPPTAEDPNSFLKQRRRTGTYRKILKHEHPNLIIRIDPEIKIKALSMHKSQVEKDPFYNFPKELADKMKKFDCFVMHKDWN